MCNREVTCVVGNPFKPARLLPALSRWLRAAVQPGWETSRWLRQTSPRSGPAGTGEPRAYLPHASPARAQAPARSTPLEGSFHSRDSFLERLEFNPLPG